MRKSACLLVFVLGLLMSNLASGLESDGCLAGVKSEGYSNISNFRLMPSDPMKGFQGFNTKKTNLSTRLLRDESYLGILPEKTNGKNRIPYSEAKLIYFMELYNSR